MTERRPSPEGVATAAKRVAGHVTRTPLLPFGRNIWIKAESLQQGGSFKLRGATNRLLQLSEEERRRGVVAFSSGNHAQGIAIAAQHLGIDAIIVMPSDAPQVKRQGTLAAGATIVDYDRAGESREEIAGRIAAETGAIVVPSFDDVDIIEGQGSVGIEIRQQLGRAPASILVPCGGGGLAAGIALALPGSAIGVVEPAGWDDMGRSLLAGRILPVEEPAPPTRCDALQTKRVSPLTFDVLRASRTAAFHVSESDVAQAMRLAAHSLKLTVEPGGAVGLAALMNGYRPAEGELVVVVSGGNVDPELYADILGRSGS